MIIYPAIDLKGGRCVRLIQGRPEDEKVYSDDPAEVARNWENQGAQWLHVVDLDGAFKGEPQNLSALEAIRSAINIPIQFGGGNRTLEILDRVFDIGIQRAVLGTAALETPGFIHDACKKHAGNIAIGIDARDGNVAVKGWRDVTSVDAVEFGNQVVDQGAGLIIYTDISRDGMLCGPNKEALKKMAEGVSIPIIASGGVSTLQDVAEIAELAPTRITGMIIGKALYEGAFSLKRALDIAAASASSEQRE